MSDQVAMHAYNEVAPGSYTDLQAAKPYPAFGQINVLENLGKSWYNGLQMKWERRFSEGLAFTASYAFGKNLGENSLEPQVFSLGLRNFRLEEFPIRIGLQLDEIGRGNNFFNFAEVDTFSDFRWHGTFYSMAGYEPAVIDHLRLRLARATTSAANGRSLFLK